MKIILFLLLSILALQALTLHDAIQIGLKNNPDILIKQNNILLSQELKNLKKATNLGKVSLRGSFTKYNIPRTLTPIVPPITSDILTSKEIGSLGIAYDVALFSGFSGIRDVEIASLSGDMSKIMLKLSRQQLIYNIRSLYLKILSLAYQKNAANFHVNALQKLHNIVKVGVEVGKKPKIDLLKVKADLVEADANIRELDANIEILKLSLASVIGVESIIEVEDIVITPFEELDNYDVTSLSRYKLSLIEEKKRDKLFQNTKSSYYPNLSLNGYYGNNYGESESDDLWQVGIGLNWVLFDFGARSTMGEKAKIEKIQSQIETEKTKLTLTKDLKESKLKVEIAQSQLQSAKAELELVQESMKIENMRYEQGVGTIYDLLFSKSRYQSTLSKEITARYTLQNAIYYYKYITENGDIK